MKKTICIVHYNTPEFTEATIKSVRKTGTDWPIVVFDNSTERPFKRRMRGLKVYDNTQQQIVNFDEELAKYPDKCWDMARKSNWGSIKHMMSVQKLWELVPDGFILLESDALVTKNIEFLWDEQFAACGKVDYTSKRTRYRQPDRLLPYLCYLNVPLLKENGAKYYDPTRSWGLQPGGKVIWNNWYDTGAPILEDIRKTKPQLVCRVWPELHNYYVHYQGASWRAKDLDSQLVFLSQHEKLWKPWEKQDAKIYICAHSDFEKRVYNPIFEVADARKPSGKAAKDVAPDGLPGSFYSEILTYQRIAAKKTLPAMVGFCGYRKYFDFMDDVPDLSKVKCIVARNMDMRMSMHEQYRSFSNVDDIDLLTQIINETAPDFAHPWLMALRRYSLHPYSMFIMPSKDFREMMKLVSSLLKEWVQRVGVENVESRVTSDPAKYNIGASPYCTVQNALRMGGNLGERIISAWIDWKFPDAQQVPVKITQEKVVNP